MRKARARVLYYQWAGFGTIIILLWINEILDLPHLLLRAAPTPINWAESLLETFLILLLAVSETALVARLLKRVKHLEGQVRICAFCQKVQDGERWVPFEEYLRSHSNAEMAYGLNPCPDCSAERFPETVGKKG